MTIGPNDRTLRILGFLVLADVFFFPNVVVSSGLPSFQISDFLMPFLVFFLLPHTEHLFREKWARILIIFSLYIPVTMLINHQSVAIKDGFEVYKWFKLLILFTLFKVQNPKNIRPYIEYCFYILLIVNVLQFYDVGYFNDLLENIYGESIHFSMFGKDSLGNPAVKRLLGTMGNPNTNALLFLFFTVYFLPSFQTVRKLTPFFLSLLFLFLCQSRTSVLALVVLLTIYFVVRRKELDISFKVWTLGAVVCLYGLAWMFSTSFFKYTSYSQSVLDGSAFYSHSYRGRWESWKILWNMIRSKPIFGYGPYKRFFTSQKLYSENEYILMWWRYGILGLGLYMWTLFHPIYHFLQRKINLYSLMAIGFVSIVVVSALTNNPLTERRISILFVFLLGSAYYSLTENDEKTALNRK